MDEVNIYCDESCHLSYDNKENMILGAVTCPKAFKRRICEDIRKIKAKYNLNTNCEMKWTKISDNQKLDAYIELVEYFFKEKNLHYRAIIANKNNLDHEKYNGGDYNNWYYKMYFLLLNHLLIPNNRYNVYIDIKDTRGGKNVNKLKDVLCNNMYDFKSEVLLKVQQIRSDESEIMQITDVFTGALNYLHNTLGKAENNNSGKIKIIEKIRQASGCDLATTTPYEYRDFNIFLWEPNFYGK